MMNEKEFNEKVYKYKSGDDQIKAEASYGYICESIEINNGLIMHVQGMQYPEKGLAPTKDIFAINQVKRLIIESLRYLKYITPSLIVFALIPYKYKISFLNKAIHSFNLVTFKMVSPSILQFQHLTPMAKELYFFLDRFLHKVGIKHAIREQFIEIFINIINFDNAYRYRLQDIFLETTIEKLQNPRKELTRLFGILAERDPNIAVTSKFKMFLQVFSIILLHPRIKRAYLFALEDLDITKVQPDKADWFWMCVRGGSYNYLGKTDKERLMLINDLRYVIPTKIQQ